MFAAFVSKQFIDNFTSPENTKSQYFHSFFTDFICKLNLDYFITDFGFDTLMSENIYFQIGFKAFRDLGIGQHQRVDTPIEFILTSKIDTVANVQLINGINYPTENILYFVHLPIEIINSFGNMKSIPLISSAAFEITYKNFLLNGHIKKEGKYSDYMSGKFKINVWTCPKTTSVLIDDPYFLIKRNTNKIDVKSIESRVKSLLMEFISSVKELRAKTIIFHIPLFKGDDRKIEWTEAEKNEISKIIQETIKIICVSSSCEVIFHHLATHARFVLTNRHFIKMSAGFDYLKKTKEELLETNDYIDYSSIFLLDINDSLRGFFTNRISKTMSKNYFPTPE